MRGKEREQLWTTADVADHLQVSPKTLDDWAYRGVGPEFSRVGGQRRYRPADVDKYLAERRRDAATAPGRG